MIDLEKYWIPKDQVIKEEFDDLSYWEDMNKNGWNLITSQGHLYGFHSYMWEHESINDHSLLEVCEDDLSDYFLVPDKLQFFIRLWLTTEIPSNASKRDCINGKHQWQIDRGWFNDPHLCKASCNKCEDHWKEKIRRECERRM